MELNTCFATTSDLRVIALYSHLIPAFISIFLGGFISIRSRFALLPVLFTLFSFSFSLWLIADVVLWTANSYNLVNAFWAPIDYINIIFYLFGAYFFAVIVRDRDLNWIQKFILFSPAIPVWWLTISNHSISYFDQTVCEALSNDFIANYKFFVELGVIAFILYFAVTSAIKSNREKVFQIISITSALLLFFGTFSITEYLSSQSGVYEINLYSLFVLPLFLLIIVYSIVSLGIFKIRLIGFQLIAYLLIIVVGSQFFILESSTDKTLSIITFILTIGFGILLIRSGKREIEARRKVEELAQRLKFANEELKELDRQKDELLGIVSHQLATPVSSLKWYIEMMSDGDLGKVTKSQKEHLGSMMAVSTNLADLVSMILDVSRIQLGRMKVDRQPLDLTVFFKEILEVIEPKAKSKNMDFQISMPKTFPKATLDKRYTRMTIENLLSNAVKYTPENGKVSFALEVTNGILKCTVKDSGVGIPKSEQRKIFGKMFRASNVRNSIDGNGFGLYVARGAIEAQGGKIWFESQEGKGTTFFVHLPLSSPPARSKK